MMTSAWAKSAAGQQRGRADQSKGLVFISCVRCNSPRLQLASGAIVNAHSRPGRSMAGRDQISFRQHGKVIHQNMLRLHQRLIRRGRFLGFRLVEAVLAGRSAGGSGG